MLEIRKNPYNKLVFVGDYPIFTDEISSDENNKKHWEDARLFAAAPELLEALKTVVADWHKTHKGGHLMRFVPREILDAEEAIAKAEGRE